MGNAFGYLYSFLGYNNNNENIAQNNEDRTKKFTINEDNSALIKMKKDPKNMSEILEFKFSTKKQISPDTFIYTYDIPNNMNLGLNLGQHIAIE